MDIIIKINKLVKLCESERINRGNLSMEVDRLHSRYCGDLIHTTSDKKDIADSFTLVSRLIINFKPYGDIVEQLRITRDLINEFEQNGGE